MSSIIGRTVFRAAPRLRATPIPRRFASSSSTVNATDDRQASKDALKTGAKRDPELYVSFITYLYLKWDNAGLGDALGR
jgi:hypothetical protein